MLVSASARDAESGEWMALKKIALLTLCLTLPVALIACGDGDSSPSDDAGMDAEPTQDSAVDLDAAADASDDSATPDASADAAVDSATADAATDAETDAGPDVPKTRLAGAADFRQFSLDYDATSGDVTITIGISEITTHTRVGLLLLDAIDQAVDYTSCGTELKMPAYAANGVNLILADPDGDLFDFITPSLINGVGSEGRPDNVMWVNPSPQFELQDGTSGNVIYDAYRVDVQIDRSGAFDVLTAKIPGTRLARHLDLSGGSLYVGAYGYLLVDPGATNLTAIEYGALEVTANLGGAQGIYDWWDADAYDLMFVDANTYDQAMLLTGTEANGGAIVNALDAGILQIPVPSEWTASFASGVIDDPEGDDTGDGDYTYPEVPTAQLPDAGMMNADAGVDDAGADDAGADDAGANDAGADDASMPDAMP